MSKSGSEGQNMDRRFNPGRRELGKRFLGASLGGAAFFPLGRDSATTHRNAPGIKIAVQSPATPTDDDLLFLKQLGAEYVSVGAPPGLRTADGFLQIKRRYES